MSSRKIVSGEEQEEEDTPKFSAKRPQAKVVRGEEQEEEESKPALKQTLDQKYVSQKAQNPNPSQTLSSVVDSKKLKEEITKPTETEEPEGIKELSVEKVEKDANLDQNKPRTALEKKIVEKNEAIRKTFASKLMTVYHLIDVDLNQTSLDLNNTLNVTQEISTNQSELNDNLMALMSRLPNTSNVVNSFLVNVSAK